MYCITFDCHTYSQVQVAGYLFIVGRHTRDDRKGMWMDLVCGNRQVRMRGYRLVGGQSTW